MLTYLCETHFWTADEDITIKHTDLGAFKYESKKTSPPSVYVEGKRRYLEARGGAWRAGGVKARLRELAELLRGARPLLCRWSGPLTLLLLFPAGALLYLLLDPTTHRVSRVLYDRYLLGKLLSPNISEVLFTDTYILLTGNDSHAVLVTFNRPSMKSTLPEKLSSRDPKIQTVELGVSGGVWAGRGAPGMSGSAGGSSALLWSRASPSDLFPWSPHTDHANVHVYSLSGSQMSLVCSHRIEFDPLCVSFSTIHDDIIFSVEQKSSKKGGVVVEWRKLCMSRCGGLTSSGPAVRLAAPAPATCCSRSPCETRLLLACSDRSILMHYAPHNLTTTVTASFVARTCCWWAGGIVAGGSGAQLQAWDSRLGPARLAPPGDHAPPDTLLDLATYFKKEPSLTQLVWNEHSGRAGDGLLLLLLRGGPLVCMRLYSSTLEQFQLQPAAAVVPRGQEARALAQLRGSDWNTQGTTCLALLHQLINTLFSAPLNADREQMAQAALGTFLAPPVPLSPTTRQQHLPHLHDLCRRFFHLLIRYGRLEKALCLAIDVGHGDLFMDVYYAAAGSGLAVLAGEAMQHAQEATSSCASSCSRLSCSRCSSSCSGEESRGDHGLEGGRVSRECEAGLDLYGAASPPPALPRRPPPPLPRLPELPQLPPLRMFLSEPGDNEGSRVNRSDWSRLPMLASLPTTVSALSFTSSPSIAPVPIPAPVSVSVSTSASARIPAAPLASAPAPPPPPPPFQQAPTVYSLSSHTRTRTHTHTPSRGRGRESTLCVSATRFARKELPHPLQVPGRLQERGEKYKVKFSDTVTVAVVPEISRKERRPVREGVSRSGVAAAGVGLGRGGAIPPDPRRELADSLPLCHPNHDYLKDFTPHPENEEQQEKVSKIKVVHFGIV